MSKTKNLIYLHISVLIFSFTGVFQKLASNEFNAGGITNPMLYVFVCLTFLNCAIYAFAWQKVIKGIELNLAYAHKTVYLIWAQIWAVILFHEQLTFQHIIGLVMVFVGVLIVQHYD
jgi:drug/metabolite transporter (DMT)-like permease